MTSLTNLMLATIAVLLSMAALGAHAQSSNDNLIPGPNYDDPMSGPSGPFSGTRPQFTPAPAGGSDGGAAYASCALSVLDGTYTPGPSGASLALSALSSCYSSLSAAGITDGGPRVSILTDANGSIITTDVPQPTASASITASAGSSNTAPSTAAPTSTAASSTTSAAPTSTSGASNGAAAGAKRPPQLATGKRNTLLARIGHIPALVLTLASAGLLVWFMDELLEMLV